MRYAIGTTPKASRSADCSLIGAPVYGSELASHIAATSPIATPPLTRIGKSARLSGGEARRQRMSQDEHDGCRDGEARVPLDAHQPHVDGHVVTDEQEVVRARATADLLDAHEHEHHDLNHERVEIGRADDEALPASNGAGRPGTRGRDARAPRSGCRSTTSPTVNGSDRFAWTSVPAKSAKPAPTMSAPVHRSRRRDEATRPAATNETPATIVNVASAGLSPRSWPRSIAAAASTAQAAAAAPMPMTIGCVRSSVPAAASVEVSSEPQRGSTADSASVRSRDRPACRHGTAAERVGLATLPCVATAGTILPCTGACSSSTTTAPSGQLRDSCSSGAASSSWPKPAAAASAVQEAKTHRPDLALVDVQLPDFDGFEVAERLSPPRPGARGDPDLEPRRIRFRGAGRGQPRARLHSQRRSVGRRRSKRCSHRPAEPASVRQSRAFPRHSVASTSSITIRSPARKRRSASSSPTTPCFCARASPVCSSARDSRSWARAARPRICC